MLAPDAFEWHRSRPIPKDPKRLTNSLVNHFVKCAKRRVPSEMPKTGLGCGYSAPPVEHPVGARHGNKMTRMDSSIDSHLKPGPNLSICMHRGGRANASPLAPLLFRGDGWGGSPPGKSTVYINFVRVCNFPKVCLCSCIWIFSLWSHVHPKCGSPES